MRKLDINKSVEQIEEVFWDEHTEYPTALIKRCFQLRKKKIKDLTVSELRTLIGQNIGLEVLHPVAIELIKKNVLVEGDYYPGDLLQSLLDINCDFWQSNKDSWRILKNIIDQKIETINRSLVITDEIKESILRSFDNFRNCIKIRND